MLSDSTGTKSSDGSRNKKYGNWCIFSHKPMWEDQFFYDIRTGYGKGVSCANDQFGRALCFIQTYRNHVYGKLVRFDLLLPPGRV